MKITCHNAHTSNRPQNILHLMGSSGLWKGDPNSVTSNPILAYPIGHCHCENKPVMLSNRLPCLYRWRHHGDLAADTAESTVTSLQRNETSRGEFTGSVYWSVYTKLVSTGL